MIDRCSTNHRGDIVIDDGQVVRIAAEALCDTRTVRKAYGLWTDKRGSNMQGLTLARIVQAAGRLGYPPPPAKATQPAR